MSHSTPVATVFLKRQFQVRHGDLTLFGVTATPLTFMASLAIGQPEIA